MLLELHGEKVLPSVGSFLTKYNYLAWDVRFFDHPRTKPFTDTRSLENAFANISNTLVCIPYEASEKRDHMIG